MLKFIEINGLIVNLGCVEFIEKIDNHGYLDDSAWYIEISIKNRDENRIIAFDNQADRDKDFKKMKKVIKKWCA